jgi:hypothetical protein
MPTPCSDKAIYIPKKKKVYEHVGLGSEIFDLPPPCKTTEAKIVATPDKKHEPDREGHYWIESPQGDPIKKALLY